MREAKDLRAIAEDIKNVFEGGDEGRSLYLPETMAAIIGQPIAKAREAFQILVKKYPKIYANHGEGVSRCFERQVAGGPKVTGTYVRSKALRGDGAYSDL